MFVLLLYRSPLVTLFVFFFKQKTAYEMRISDWSSDVCSSDLYLGPERRDSRRGPGGSTRLVRRTPYADRLPYGDQSASRAIGSKCNRRSELHLYRRSEEHTSELQSLMRISYAVFCLKKKNNKRSESTPPNHTKTDNNTVS